MVALFFKDPRASPIAINDPIASPSGFVWVARRIW
jgi:hypothetical protein